MEQFIFIYTNIDKKIYCNYYLGKKLILEINYGKRGILKVLFLAQISSIFFEIHVNYVTSSYEYFMKISSNLTFGDMNK